MKRQNSHSAFLCDPGGIQTHNLLIRSQMLYSVEPRDLYLVGVKRLELSTPCTPCKCASQLRHTPFVSCAKVDIFPIYG